MILTAPLRVWVARNSAWEGRQLVHFCFQPKISEMRPVSHASATSQRSHFLFLVWSHNILAKKKGLPSFIEKKTNEKKTVTNDVTEFLCRVVPASTEFRQNVGRRFTGFYRVLPGFTGFYLVLLGCFNCGAANRVERNRWKRARRNGARHRSQSRSNRVEKPSKTVKKKLGTSEASKWVSSLRSGFERVFNRFTEFYLVLPSFCYNILSVTE